MAIARSEVEKIRKLEQKGVDVGVHTVTVDAELAKLLGEASGKQVPVGEKASVKLPIGWCPAGYIDEER